MSIFGGDFPNTIIVSPVNDGTKCQAVLEAVGHVIDSQTVVGLQLLFEPCCEGVGANVALPAEPLLFARVMSVVALCHRLCGSHGIGSLDCLQLLLNLEQKIVNVKPSALKFNIMSSSVRFFSDINFVLILL